MFVVFLSLFFTPIITPFLAPCQAIGQANRKPPCCPDGQSVHYEHAWKHSRQRLHLKHSQMHNHENHTAPVVVNIVQVRLSGANELSSQHNMRVDPHPTWYKHYSWLVMTWPTWLVLFIKGFGSFFLYFFNMFGPNKPRKTITNTQHKLWPPSSHPIASSSLFICLALSFCRTCMKMLKAGPPGL